jgi:hypothetical protein
LGTVDLLTTAPPSVNQFLIPPSRPQIKEQTMSRSARILRSEKPTVYHVISRTTLPGLPLSDADKDQLVHLLQKFAAMFFVDILGFCIDPVK